MIGRPEAVEIEAPAKVNLTLRILEREPSGYHRLETLFQAVDLTDRLRAKRTNSGDVTLELIGPEPGPTEDNLVVRAARAYLDAAGEGAPGIHLTLEKRIPAGAGLGGGSSDAAATLRALDAIVGGVDPARLATIAAALGSDVPFFLGGSPYALARGRGEILTPLEPLPPVGVVLGFPPVHVPTAHAYGWLAAARGATGGRVPPAILGDAPPATWGEVAEIALNDFEEVVVPAYPEVGKALRALRAAAGPLCLLSGSGGAVFSVHQDLARAEAVAVGARERAPRTLFAVVSTVARMPAVTPVG